MKYLNWHTIKNTSDTEITVYPSGSAEIAISGESCWFNDIDDAIDDLRNELELTQKRCNRNRDTSSDWLD